MKNFISSCFKRKNIVPVLIVFLILFRVITGLFGFRLYSIYAEEVYVAIIGVLAIAHLIYRQRSSKVKVVLTVVFSIISVFLLVVVSFLTWLVVGAVDEVKPEKFSGIEQRVWIQFHQASWGGEPYETLSYGESIFWGLMYREDAHLKIGFYDEVAPWSEADNYDLPANIDIEECIFWEQKELLFDMKNKHCYRLKRKREVPLSQQEKACEVKFESQWKASISVEKGNCSVEPIYALANVVYVTVDFYDQNKRIQFTNSDVEKYTNSFCTEFSARIQDRSKYDTIIVLYLTHDNRDGLFIEDDDYQRTYKYGKYDIRNSTLISNKMNRDYIKPLYLPWTKYLIITYNNGRNEDQKAWSGSLGGELHNIRDDFRVKEKGRVIYKGLDCQVYIAKHPEKIKTPNGYLLCEIAYYLHEDKVVDVDILYKAFPENNKFTYKEVVNKITYPSESSLQEDVYYKFASTKYVKFRYECEDFTIVSKADTTHIPWTIDYRTSITKPNFIYCYKGLK